MRTMALLLTLALGATPAAAQDDLDDIPNYGEDDDAVPVPADDPDADPDDEADDGSIEFDDDGDPGAPLSLGTDTSVLFSARFEAIKSMDPEDRSAAWDTYLVEYPDTAYRSRIVDLQQQALDELYDEEIDDGRAAQVSKRGILLTESVLLDNMNPATRVKFGFDWGLPDWINLIADVEYALNPNLSFHGGLRKRYTGWSVEPGARWAFVKSEKLQTVASFLGDARINVNPAFVALRPQLAVGTKIGDRVDLQGQGGVELASADGFWTQTAIGGGNLSVRASKGVALYAEGSFYAKYLGWAGGTFRFHVVGFGMKFFPRQKGTEQTSDPMEMTFGASVPWSYYPVPNWEYHQGSVVGQATFYVDE
mgnify:CR=1 FL=1